MIDAPDFKLAAIHAALPLESFTRMFHRNPNRANQCHQYVCEALAEFNISSSIRMAAFLAQVAHETGCLQYSREIWGPTEAQLKYEGREDLGNTQLGDGKKYRGRGAFQITGRNNYRKYGLLLGVDLEQTPELAAMPNYSFRIAGAYWDINNLNKYADLLDFMTITKRINGGLNGYHSRLEYYEDFKKVLNCA